MTCLLCIRIIQRGTTDVTNAGKSRLATAQALCRNALIAAWRGQMHRQHEFPELTSLITSALYILRIRLHEHDGKQPLRAKGDISHTPEPQGGRAWNPIGQVGGPSSSLRLELAWQNKNTEISRSGSIVDPAHYCSPVIRSLEHPKKPSQNQSQTSPPDETNVCSLFCLELNPSSAAGHPPAFLFLGMTI